MKIKKIVKDNKILASLGQEQLSEETSEWIGFVKTLKIFIKRSSDGIRGEVKDVREEINAKIDGVNGKIDGVREEIKGEIKDVRGEIKDMKDTLQAILAHVKPEDKWSFRLKKTISYLQINKINRNKLSIFISLLFSHSIIHAFL